MKSMLGWLGNNMALYNEALQQTVVSVFNMYTREETVYNPLRAKRPTADSTSSDFDRYTCRRYQIQEDV